MNKQIVRIAALTLCVITFAVGSARAQNSGTNMRVSIPFDFVIGVEKLPAGEYEVRGIGSLSTIRLQRLDQTTGTYFAVNPVQARDIQGKSKLVFHKYGDQYFLSQIWNAGRASGGELIRPSRERILQREIAGRTRKPESVAVTARAN